MATREQELAKNLRAAAVAHADDQRNQDLDKKLLRAAVLYAEEAAVSKVFRAALELGAVNANEADRVMRGHPSREKPPGLTEAIGKLRRAEKSRDRVLAGKKKR